MLDHLAACGHVERVRSQTDRRVVVSRLTEQGAGEDRRPSARPGRAAGRQALGDVSERDLRAATHVLQRLGAMFDEVPAEAACEPDPEGCAKRLSDPAIAL